jgi:ubiquinone/menaquinone biosynthesis C-methylase UbiE
MTTTMRETIWNHQWAFSRTVALRTAIQLGLFGALGRGRRTAAAVARACRTSVDGTRRLLDALAGMELIRSNAGRYRLAPGVERYLAPEGDEYIGPLLVRSERMMEFWASMPKAVRTGKPAQSVDQARKAAVFYPDLAAGLYTATLETAGRAARALRVGSRLRDLRILDVAAGSGVWSLEFARRDPGARVTAIDFSEVLRVTRRFVRQNGMVGRYRYLPGDLRRIDFGREAYDMVILGQICHSEGPVWTRRLLRKSARSLVRGGNLVIAEFIPNDSRTGPLYPLVFSMHMFLMTKEGDTFTMSDYRSWLRAAGFGPPRRIAGIRPPAAVLHARRK